MSYPCPLVLRNNHATLSRHVQCTFTTITYPEIHTESPRKSCLLHSYFITQLDRQITRYSKSVQFICIAFSIQILAVYAKLNGAMTCNELLEREQLVEQVVNNIVKLKGK
jgi:hypothetical protein